MTIAERIASAIQRRLADARERHQQLLQAGDDPILIAAWEGQVSGLETAYFEAMAVSSEESAERE